jgi:hypothetical protein
MKYLKRFNLRGEKSILDWCKEFNLNDYTINVDDSVDTKSYNYIFISNKKLGKIPIQFGKVIGDFYCSNNKLTSLKGCPKEVSGRFDCSINRLVTLEGGPESVGENVNCMHNILTSLQGAPLGTVKEFICDFNLLVNLIGCTENVSTYFSCIGNKLLTLDGMPKMAKSSTFICYSNPIHEVYELFETCERYKASLDYNYWRDGKINKRRFELACKEAGIVAPDSISGYEYIDL